MMERNMQRQVIDGLPLTIQSMMKNVVIVQPAYSRTVSFTLLLQHVQYNTSSFMVLQVKWNPVQFGQNGSGVIRYWMVLLLDKHRIKHIIRQIH